MELYDLYYSPARQWAIAARIMEMGVDPELAARLTPKQKNRLCFPRRNPKDGSIVIPEVIETVDVQQVEEEVPETLEAQLQALEELASIGILNQAAYEKACAEVRRKFAAKE